MVNRANIGTFSMSIIGAVGIDPNPDFEIAASKHGSPKGIDKRLAKIFKIDHDTAKRTLDVTTQHV